MLMFFLVKLVVSLSLHSSSLNVFMWLLVVLPALESSPWLLGLAYIRLFCISTARCLTPGRNVFSLTAQNLFERRIMFEHGSAGEDCSVWAAGAFLQLFFLLEIGLLFVIKNPVWLTALRWWGVTLGYWSWKCGFLKASEEPRAWHWISTMETVQAGCSLLGKVCHREGITSARGSGIVCLVV